jgi:hypothetical protein
MRTALVEATLARVQEMMERLRAPETPPGEVADLLVEIWDEDGVPRGVLLGSAVPGDPARLREIAEAVDKRAPGSVLARVVAVELRGLVDGDREGGLRALEDLLLGLGLPARVNAAWRAIPLGAPERAAAVARKALTVVAGWGEADSDLDPEQREETAAAAERLLAAAVYAAGEGQPADKEPGAGARVVEEFLDPAVLCDLEDALVRWLDRTPDAAAVVAEQVTELREVLPEETGEVIPVDHAEALVRCHALLLAGTDEQDGEQDGEDDDSNAVIRRFAADPSVTPPRAAAARRWAETIHFGLWQLDEPPANPGGCHLVDLVTSVEHFVPLDPASLGPVGRWSVLLGPLACVDGVWRPAAPLLPLSPAEGDALAELVNRMSDMIAAELAGPPRRRPGRAAARSAPFGTAPPHGVTATERDAAPLPVARVLNMITGSGLARLIAEVAACRLAGPRLHNTDGDPLILVKATLAAGDPDAVAAKLASHPDIQPDDEEPGGFTWWGRELTEAEREPMLAQAAAELGIDPAEIDTGGAAQRWLRGRVTRRGEHLVLEVNSLARLDRFCDLLRELGATPTVVDKTTVDPALDMVLPRGQLIPAGLSPQAGQAWAGHWLDEKIPALNGRTPRQAAASQRHWPLLEALLRQFEWQEDMRAHATASASSELAWLREQLDMPGLP